MFFLKCYVFYLVQDRRDSNLNFRNFSSQQKSWRRHRAEEEFEQMSKADYAGFCVIFSQVRE